MLQYLIIPLMLSMFVFSYYIHFVHHSAFTSMIAFVGEQHVRMFEREFNHVNADLWAFGHRKRKYTRLKFGQSPFKIFDTYDYSHMLLVTTVRHIPIFFDAEHVIEYRFENNTVASFWPRLKHSPPDVLHALDWYRTRGGKVDIIHLQ